MDASVRVGLRHVGDVDLMVDDRGPEDAPTMVIALGFSAQLGGVMFPDDFADALSARNWRVVRFDCRDIGLSTGFDDFPVDLDVVAARVAAGEPVEVPYTLVHMADDIAGIVAGLGSRARVRLVGVSLGGLIVRWAAVRHPELVGSLVVLMSPLGTPGPGPAALRFMRAKAERRTRDAAIDHEVEMWRSYAGTAFPFDEGWVRRRVEFAYERSYRPEAMTRQLAARMATASITAEQPSISVPTRVVHGDCDPVVPVAEGIALGEAIPGAELVVIPGLGHELPPAAWPGLLDLVASPIPPEGHARSARGTVRSSV
jgi:pimeloyl-ACP methyl ester carboxylesterase